MLRFNTKGLLTPNSNIQSSLEELETEFVKNIVSEKRKYLFTRYKEYTMSLQKELRSGSFFQWIDGSFTTKKSEPQDIDVVSFISNTDLEKNSLGLEKFRYPFSLPNFDIDAYIVVVYPNEHENYPFHLGDRLYWMNLFDKGKRNRSGVKTPKGFLELNFN